MANVRKFEFKQATSNRVHTDVDATISMVEAGGERFIQIDTYGSADREIPGKTSQSLRISKSAFDEIVDMGKNFF